MQEIDYTIPHDGEEFRIVKSGYACGKVESFSKKQKEGARKAPLVVEEILSYKTYSALGFFIKTDSNFFT